METDAIVATVVLCLVVVISATGKFRLDIVALCGLFALYLAGILTMTEIYAGFADPIVLMIAATFIVGLAVVKSGIADMLAELISKTAGGNMNRLIMVVMASTGLVSAFMSSTGTVAVMMPVAISSAAALNVSPSKVLLPTAYAALLGAWLTLIATPPNMIVSDALVANGYPALGFFAFTPFGVIALIVGTIFTAWVGVKVIPERVAVVPIKNNAAATIVANAADGTLADMPGVGRPSKKSLPWYSRYLPAWIRNRLYPAKESIESSPSKSLKPTPAGPNDAANDPLMPTPAPTATEHDLEKAEPAHTDDALVDTDEQAGETVLADADGAPLEALVQVKLRTPSPTFDGKAVAELKLRNRYGISLLAIAKRTSNGAESVRPVYVDTVLHAGNTVFVFGPAPAVAAFVADYPRELSVEAPAAEGEPGSSTVMLPAPLVLAEFMISPTSVYLGSTIKEAGIETRYSVTVLSVRRGRTQTLGQDIGSTVLASGDIILMTGHLRTLKSLYDRTHDQTQDLIYVSAIPDTGLLGRKSRRGILRRVKDRWRFAATVLVIIGMLVIMTGAWLPNSFAVLLAALALILLRVLGAEESYRAINWESIVLTAAMLGVVQALDKTGIIDSASQVIASVGSAGPHATLALLFVIVSVVGQLMSNTACTVLFAPVGISVAQASNVNPQAFMIAISIAAASSFMTPIGSPVVLMVYNPGAYQVMDYVKAGTPLYVFMFLLTLGLAPALFPF